MIDFNKLKEEKQLIEIEYDKYCFLKVKNPSEEFIIKALKKNIYVLELIENPSEKLQLYAIRKSVFNIVHINNPIEKVQLLAVKKDPEAICYIKGEKSEAVQIEAVKNIDYSISSYNQYYISKNIKSPKAIELYKKLKNTRNIIK